MSINPPEIGLYIARIKASVDTAMGKCILEEYGQQYAAYALAKVEAAKASEQPECECDEISNGETCIKCGPSAEQPVDCREAFEKWASDQGYTKERNINRGVVAYYYRQPTNFAWYGWQAAWNARATTRESGTQADELPEVREALDKALWDYYTARDSIIIALPTLNDVPQIAMNKLRREDIEKRIFQLESAQAILDKYVAPPKRESVTQALAMLHSMIDGGEECRGRDSEISDVIRLLEQSK